MALVVYDRVQQTGTANTTVSFTLTGSVVGYQSFSVIGNGNTTFYAATDVSGDWEVGIGTYSTTGPTLTRTTILSSSNSGSAVTFSGTVNVFVTYPSEKSVNLDASGNVTALGTITSGVWNGTTIPVAYGGTGVTSSSGANSVVLRDSNSNVTANNVLNGYTAVTSAAGTTVLTAASSYIQRLTGSTTQTFQLPNATTLPNGTAFIFDNDSSGLMTIVDNASTVIDTVPSGGVDFIYLINNGTSAGTWTKYAFLPGEFDFSATNASFNNATITNAVWNGTTVATGYGGTGLTGFSAANNAIYSTSSSALTAGTLPVAAGGTGATSLTGYVYGNGTGAMTASTTIPTSALSGNYVSTFQTSLSGLSPSTSSTGGITLSGTLGAASGGTGANTLTGYVYGNGTSAMTASTTIPGSAISGNISGNAANVTGTVAIANGGTGQTSASAAFNALSPITSTGDLIVGNGSNSATRLGIGSSGQVLTSNGTTATWSTPSSGAGTITNTAFTATSGQTTFSVTYTVGLIEVFRNGVCLVPGTDYTATSGTSVVLATGANSGDSILVVAFSSLNIYSTFTTDTFSGNGSTTAFTMSVSPSSASATLVVISGVTQDPSTYTVSGNTLTFSAAPPSGTNNISVRYLGVPATGVVSSFQTSLSGLTPSTGTTGAVTLGGVLGPSSGGTGQTNITFPSSGGTAMVSGNMPAFSAYLATNQNVSAGTWTKVTFNNKDFDTNNCYDATTNYRFTPNVAGYYQFNIAASGYSTSSNTNVQTAIYKNGSLYRAGPIAASSGQGANYMFSGIIYLNGSTDYIEVYAYSDSVTATILGNSPTARTASTFSASLIRGA